MRTLSKWAGLAGLRVGYSIAHHVITKAMLTVKQPYNINTVAEQAAIAALNARYGVCVCVCVCVFVCVCVCVCVFVFVFVVVFVLLISFSSLLSSHFISPLTSSPLISPLLSSHLLSSPLISSPLLSSPLLSSPLISSPLLSSPLISPHLSSLLTSHLISPLNSPLTTTSEMCGPQGPVQQLALETQRIAREITLRFPFLSPLPTTTNFVLIRVKGVSASALAEALLERGVMIRYFGSQGGDLSGYIRISAGRKRDGDVLLKALEDVVENGVTVVSLRL